jgi:fructose-bisphosphate aldolase class II
MKTLREAIEHAEAQHRAIGHFNVSDSNQLNAIADAAQELQVPVIIGVSEGERKWFGVRHIAALVQSFRSEGREVYLNADHTKTIEGIEEAIAAGFDAVLFDGSKLSIDENIAQTRAAVAAARTAERPVLVEGELGYIGSSSSMLDDIPEGAGLEQTDPEVAARFARETGIDLLAPSVGNIHGMLKNAANPKLNIERVGSVRSAAGVPLVLHGGSGIADEDFVAAIKAGVSIVHINTEIRAAYRKGIEQGLAADANEVSPYKYMGPGYDALKAVVRARLALFAGIS